MGREPVSAGSGSVGETFGPLPGYNKGPLVERSADLFFYMSRCGKERVIVDLRCSGATVRPD